MKKHIVFILCCVMCMLTLCVGVYAASFLGIKISGKLNVIPFDKLVYIEKVEIKNADGTTSNKILNNLGLYSGQYISSFDTISSFASNINVLAGEEFTIQITMRSLVDEELMVSASHTEKNGVDIEYEKITLPANAGERAATGESRVFEISISNTTANNVDLNDVNIILNCTPVLEVKKYSVTVLGDENCIVDVAQTVEHGSDLQFTITANEGYTLDNAIIKVNGESVTLESNSYTINNVTSDITINIDGIELLKYDINIVAGDKSVDVELLPATMLSEVFNFATVVNFMDYNTNGELYFDAECTQVASLTNNISSDMVIYSKPATLDKLSFVWDANRSTYGVKAKNTSISGEVLIPKKYTDGTHSALVTHIEAKGFANCGSVTNVIMLNYITNIGNSAFDWCKKITSLDIPDSVTNIGDHAFYYTGLTSITIGENVKKVGLNIVAGCEKLKSISTNNNSIYIAEGNCLIEKTTNALVAGCSVSVIPNYVTKLNPYSFFSSNIEEVTIPANVEVIDEGAFNWCESLRVVTIAPNSKLTTIKVQAFGWCWMLETINLPKSILSIDSGAFASCSSLQEVIVDSDTSWENNTGNSKNPNWVLIENASMLNSLRNGKAIRQCRVLSIKIGDTTENFVLSKDASTTTAMNDENVRNFINPKSNGVLYIDQNYTQKVSYGETIGYGTTLYAKQATLDKLTFSYSNGLVSVSAKDTFVAGDIVIPVTYEDAIVYEIGSNAFSSLKITSVAMSDELVHIQHFAFYKCSNLVNVEIGSAVQYIGSYAFNACKVLTSINIPDSVTWVDVKAFYSCSKVTDMYIGSGLLQVGTDAFAATNLALTTIEVNPNNRSFYVENNCLVEKGTKTVILAAKNASIPETVEVIGRYAFYWYSFGSNGLVIPNSVTTIDAYAFYYATVTKLVIGSGLRELDTMAFIGISKSLTTIQVSNNPYFTSQGNCLINVTTKSIILGTYSSAIPMDDSVTTIGYGAFTYCGYLTSIYIPSNISRIEELAFDSCTNLTEIIFAQKTNWYRVVNGSEIEQVDGQYLPNVVIQGCLLYRI